MFQIVDFSKQADEILQVMEQNVTEAVKVRGEIATLKKKLPSLDIPKTTEVEKQEEYVELEEPNEWEEEIQFYLDGYRKLRDDFTLEDLLATLPKRNQYHYREIILRLMAESYKEINYLQESGLEEGDITTYDELIVIEQKKIKELRHILTVKEEELPVEDNKENTLVLMANQSGTIRVIDDIEHIPVDFYSGFKQLIDSIKTSTFKSPKTFKSGQNISVTGICEVRGPKMRVLFQKIGPNTYVIISAFIKKVTSDKAYRELIANRVQEYKSVMEKIKANLDNPEYIALNQTYVDELYRILGEDEKNPVLFKGVE